MSQEVLSWQDQQDEIRRAKETIAGPVPLIEDSPDVSFTLPKGLHQDGETHKTVVVRELTGLDEETLSRLRDPADFYDAVIGLGTVSIGSIDLSEDPLSDRQAILQGLLIGERDQVFLAIVRATYGDTKSLTYTCPSCDYQQELVLNLIDDFPPKEVGDFLSSTLTYVTSKKDSVEYRLASGRDQIEAMKRKGASTSEQNSVILSRCILNVNGHPALDPLAYARGLSMRDRQAMLNELTSRQPIVDLTITVTCIECKGEQAIALGWGDLFRP